MSEIAIQVRDLGKRYQIGGQREAYGTLRDTISSVAKAPFVWLKHQGGMDRMQEFWALRNISFEVKSGEVIGIIGRNGAGKSTLLKILARVTYPTEGWADICGRVGSLLEVGTGFHPELTGRENIFLNGAVLGMKKAEIQRKFDEIVDFAEIEHFLDTPVKRYSSGMYMRLAFAVAAHLEPEILIVDEVLAVGDAAFQKKCLGKMGEVAHEGRTVLFVSHNLLAVENLCDRVIYLSEGKNIQQGRPNQVISTYLQNAMPATAERFFPAVATIQEEKEIRLHCVRVRPIRENDSEVITVHTPFALEFEYWNPDPTASISVSYSLYNEQDILLFDICPPVNPNRHLTPSPQGLLRTVCHIPGDFLNDGLHRVDLIILNHDARIIHEPYALTFNVQDTTAEREGWYGDWPGAIRPKLRWENDLILPVEVKNHAL